MLMNANHATRWCLLELYLSSMPGTVIRTGRNFVVFSLGDKIRGKSAGSVARMRLNFPKNKLDIFRESEWILFLQHL